MQAYIEKALYCMAHKKNYIEKQCNIWLCFNVCTKFATNFSYIFFFLSTLSVKSKFKPFIEMITQLNEICSYMQISLVDLLYALILSRAM